MIALSVLFFAVAVFGAFIGCCLFFLCAYRELRRPDNLEHSDRVKLDDILICISAIHFKQQQILKAMGERDE